MISAELGNASGAVGLLALHSGVPVVPIAIGGTESVHMRWPFAWRARVSVRFGPPVVFSRGPGAPRSQAVADAILHQIGALLAPLALASHLTPWPPSSPRDSTGWTGEKVERCRLSASATSSGVASSFGCTPSAAASARTVRVDGAVRPDSRRVMVMACTLERRPSSAWERKAASRMRRRFSEKAMVRYHNTRIKSSAAHTNACRGRAPGRWRAYTCKSVS